MKQNTNSKITYKVQIIASVAIILLANILGVLFTHWIYNSIGFVLCGLLWIIHPVLPNVAKISKMTLLWTRIAGFILVLIGILTRVFI